MPDPHAPPPPIRSASIAWPGGLAVEVLDHGATLGRILVPTRSGPRNVLLSYPTVDGYRDDPWFLGATVGRYANRIANGRFRLDGRLVQLTTDPAHGPHCLHGGPGGLHRKRFELKRHAAGRGVRCRHRSPDGDQGFPGNVDISVDYDIVDAATLTVTWTASSDAETVISLSSHAYFRLDDGPTIAGHTLQLNCSRYTPCDDTLIPTGELLPVAGTPYDLRRGVRLGDRLADAALPARQSGGYDQNLAIDGSPGSLRPAARLHAPASSLRMEVLTTQPGLQLYTGGALGAPFGTAAGLCLETQSFPDAPNHPRFPSARLAPGRIYRECTLYRFHDDPAAAR